MRFVCIADSHGEHEYHPPDGDVLIHAGDLCNWGTIPEAISAARWLKSLRYQYKIVIAGNHDWPAQRDPALFKRIIEDAGCHYLYDSHTRLPMERGELSYGPITVYGTPWQPPFMGWAFNLRDPMERLRMFSGIPEHTDILITHCPPHGILDEAPRIGDTPRLENTGCQVLMDVIKERKNIKYHIFGHIHCGHGIKKVGNVWHINASICDEEYNPSQDPVVFEYGEDPRMVESDFIPPDGNPAAWEER